VTEKKLKTIKKLFKQLKQRGFCVVEIRGKFRHGTKEGGFIASFLCPLVSSKTLKKGECSE
jgi:hypothetical protein